jgi:dimethylamine/trimethylamine dehydrogenase
LTQINKMKNVSMYPTSPMTAEEILESGAQNIILATGATWRRDGVGRTLWKPIQGFDLENIFTPDDLMDLTLESRSLLLDAGQHTLSGTRAVRLQNVVIYDDDHYYMGSVLAELLIAKGCRVSFVTPSTKVAEWSVNTLEQGQIQRRLLELGAEVITSHALTDVALGSVTTACTYTGRSSEISCDCVLLVTSRFPNDELFIDLMRQKAKWTDSGIESVKVIGDAQAPAAIAWATYAGHRYAEEFDMPDIGDALPFKRELAGLRT